MEVASNQRFNDKQDGRHVGTRTPDLYRVNSLADDGTSEKE